MQCEYKLNTVEIQNSQWSVDEVLGKNTEPSVSQPIIIALDFNYVFSISLLFLAQVALELTNLWKS